MKINFKAVIIALLIVACAIFFGSTVFKTVTKNQQNKAASAEMGKLSKDAKNAKLAQNLGTNLFKDQKFTNLDLNLVGSCVIKQGEEFSFKTTLDSDKVNFNYDEKNSSMKVSMRDNVNFRFGENDYYFEITLPSLTTLSMDGAGKYDVSGFKGETLNISTNGAGSINMEDLGYKSLSVRQNGLGELIITDGVFETADLRLSGAGKLDLKESTIKDAAVHQSGLGEIVLTMDGGSLTGELSGLGQIVCYGKVGSKNINVTGLGSINFKD